MPLTTGKGSQSTQYGNITQILIGEQPAYETRVSVSPAANTPSVNTTNGFYKFQPKINSADIAREGSTIPTDFFTGDAAQSRDAAGPLDITNGMVIALSGNGTGLLLRMLTQDKNPEWNIYGGSGQSIPGSMDIAANQTLGTVTTDAGTPATVTSRTFANPVQPIIAIPGTATLGSGGRGRVIIGGTDNDDKAISETVAFTDPLPSGNRTANTQLWYKTVDSVSSAGWGSGNFGVTGQDKSARVIFTPQDDDLVAFWTVEATKGVVPNVYDGVIVENATMEITREGLIAFTCSVLGREARLYTNLSGATLAYNETAGGSNRAERTTITRTGSNGILEASPDVYAGWQCEISGGNDIPMAAVDTTLTMNQELVYTNVTGSRFQVTKPGRGAKRMLQIEASTVYAPENNYSDYFNSNQTLQNVQITWKQSGLGAYPYELTLEVPEMQLTADPDPAVTDLGIIFQNVVMKAIKPENVNIDYDYRFIARYSDYAPVRVYT